MRNRFKCASKVMTSFCFLLFIVSMTAFGQSDPLVIPSVTGEGNFDIETENKTLKDELDMSDLNRITLQQMGDMNQAFIEQYSKNDPNLAKVLQKGDENFAKLFQKGDANAVDIQQYGNGNGYSGTHRGDDNLNTVLQVGDGNFIEQFLDANSLDFQLNQFGNGHELFQEENRDGIGYKVTQKGNVGMKIEIKQDNIYK
ncbi:MAG: hypothetical protein KAI08_01990 [Bacteroidales bacterium]|nr:hypothetical protein [Bacteroidales bacterium]